MNNKIFEHILILVAIVAVFFSYNITLLKPDPIVINDEENYKVPENILFLGDSITDFYELEKYYEDTTYMVNSGFSGYSAEQLRRELQEKAYRYNPSKVFLLVGTNDIQLRRGPEEIFGYIKDIVEGFQKVRPYTKIYIESIYPINNSDDPKIDHEMVGIRTNEKVEEVNKLIKDYCEKEKITYIDMNAELQDEEGKLNINYTRDGLHMNEEGYKKITEILKEYI
ncbi:MAG: hypothetical protein IJ193_02755 [Bacilli bacterium]|nr:hypothetical protein [Bacilli bacterium]